MYKEGDIVKTTLINITAHSLGAKKKVRLLEKHKHAKNAWYCRRYWFGLERWFGLKQVLKEDEFAAV